MRAGLDPYAVLGVRRGATDTQIHTAYRAAVRRTHPDAGGSSAAFEDVQDAYEQLRDPAKRSAAPAPPPPRARTQPPAPASGRSSMEDLLAESQRLEDEARKLAGMASRRRGDEEPADNVGDVLRDAGSQLRDAADEGVRELRRFIRRRL